ncbi:PiggyBac transposable element-derived protein 4 [Portunus trituberculatus]|uniref:PiggyBac transposable element-derived protein 4 n=1 Tax=Portunus trituberculatus TaxID=210409 RepID=A0A5B7FTS0_PORTR|nr:PiggyBac transposable element-derived protein 4 [Portunus trituberculatus]
MQHEPFRFPLVIGNNFVRRTLFDRVDAPLVPSGKKNRNKEEVFKPESVMAYNKAKEGVDVSDQYTSYYSPLRKIKKWYRKLALELITGLSVVNAWVLHRQYFPRNKMSRLQFREALVCSFIGDEAENSRPGKKKSSCTD